MIVAYDLRYASDHFTGIGTHGYNVLEALLELPGPERYAVLWNPTLGASRFDLAALRRHPRVDWFERSWAPLGPASPWRVGHWLRGLRPACYLSPFHLTPIRPRCPCVLTLHDVWPLRLPAGLGFWPRTLYKLALARVAQARLVLTPSEFSRREIMALTAIESYRIRVVRLGIPASRGRLTPQRPVRLPEGPFALVVGVNRPHKNLATLAGAWGLLGDTAPLRLVAVGPDDQRHPGIARLAEREGALRVLALGTVTEHELEWLYRNAALVVMPTLYEGFGLPMVEAFAHGNPVLASDIPSLREIGEGAARFVPALDVAAWAAQVRALAGDRKARHAMAAAGLARAAELTYERTARATLAVLREAAA